MKTINLLEGVEYSDKRSLAEPILGDSHCRIIRFAMKPNQMIKEHETPSALTIVVLQGKGVFTGENGESKELSQYSLVNYAPTELHSIRALDSELVFLAYLPGAADTNPEHPPVGLIENKSE